MKLRQPKVVGEILAGVVLGRALFGRLPVVGHLVETARHTGNILTVVYSLGLLLLMFLSGAEMQHLFGRREQRALSWLVIVGTGTPLPARAGFRAPFDSSEPGPARTEIGCRSSSFLRSESPSRRCRWR